MSKPGFVNMVAYHVFFSPYWTMRSHLPLLSVLRERSFTLCVDGWAYYEVLAAFPGIGTVTSSSSLSTVGQRSSGLPGERGAFKSHWHQSLIWMDRAGQHCKTILVNKVWGKERHQLIQEDGWPWPGVKGNSRCHLHREHSQKATTCMRQAIPFVRAGEKHQLQLTKVGGLLATTWEWQLNVNIGWQLKFSDTITVLQWQNSGWCLCSNWIHFYHCKMYHFW